MNRPPPKKIHRTAQCEHIVSVLPPPPDWLRQQIPDELVPAIREIARRDPDCRRPLSNHERVFMTEILQDEREALFKAFVTQLCQQARDLLDSGWTPPT